MIFLGVTVGLDYNNVFVCRMSDFSRLARRLTGTSIGLVLGGGGARYSSVVVHGSLVRRMTKRITEMKEK